MHRSVELTIALYLVAALFFGPEARAAGGEEVQARIDTDLEAGRPLVVHVVVALCDNESQGIVPVPEALGDGRNPRTNLYWGALYGLDTHLPRAGWTRLQMQKPERPEILRRSGFHISIERQGASVSVFLVADAWDGAGMRYALEAFFRMAAGDGVETVTVNGVPGSEGSTALEAGGAAHLVAFLGHNGLMDLDLTASAARREDAPPRSALVLACASKPYFEDHLETLSAHPLLLTTGLMAPEAYTLDAAVRAWARGSGGSPVVEAAAAAYHRYQKCGLGAARRLFWSAP